MESLPEEVREALAEEFEVCKSQLVRLWNSTSYMGPMKRMNNIKMWIRDMSIWLDDVIDE